MQKAVHPIFNYFWLCIGCLLHHYGKTSLNYRISTEDFWYNLYHFQCLMVPLELTVILVHCLVKQLSIIIYLVQNQDWENTNAPDWWNPSHLAIFTYIIFTSPHDWKHLLSIFICISFVCRTVMNIFSRWYWVVISVCELTFLFFG